MLSSISWQNYLAAVILLIISYYGYIALRYYQTELADLFNRKKSSSRLLPDVQSSSLSVMGAAKLDNGITLTSTDELQFTDPLPDDPETFSAEAAQADHENILIGDPLQQLVLKARNLITAFQDVDNKQEFLNLLRILINSYKRYNNALDLPDALGRIVALANLKLQFTSTLSDLQDTGS